MPSDDIFDINVDLVMCIDGTGSMGHVIEMVKDNVMTFHERLKESLKSFNREVDELRIKVIVFRDLTCDGDDALIESPFFQLPQEVDKFKEFVMKITAVGGGDAPETALDAIALAMKSDWVKTGAKRRHAIMVWTDAPTKDVYGGGSKFDLPKTNAELFSMWDDPQMGMNSNAKRLIVFAPDDPSWAFVDELENTYWAKSNLNGGLQEFDLEAVLRTLSASL
ncbi:MAG: VWA domain-containing protein [Candidatus Methanomethylophilaceae archaeon]|jgi:hypothetical protein|nr:VWA domain-containing protein [Candidatus Methanomethylophilaceae archaeon]